MSIEPGQPAPSNDEARIYQAAHRLLQEHGNPAQEAFHASEWEDMAVEQVATSHERDEAQYEATHDPLTGLYNRRGFEKKMNQIFDTNPHAPVGIMFIDLDKFSTINNTLGHARGDKFLQDVAGLLGNRLRKDDERPGDILAHDEATLSREGGDEFTVGVLLTPGDSPKADLSLTAEERLQAIHDRLHEGFQGLLAEQPDIQKLGVGVSIGEAIWQPGMHLSEAKEIADKRMYLVKGAHKRASA